MSYPIQLDEYDEATLREELARRDKMRELNRCDYCGRKYNAEPACRFGDRHANRDKSQDGME